MQQKWKQTTYAALAMTTLLSPFGLTGTALADSSSGTQHPLAQEQKAPEGQLQKAQVLSIVQSEVFPALAQYELGDFLQTLTQNSANYNEDGAMFNFPTWNVRFTPPLTTKSGPQASFFTATLDARTGELMSFDLQNPDWQGTEGPSADVVAAKADAFLKNFEPSLYATMQMSKMPLGSSSATIGQPGNTQYKFFYSTEIFYQTVNGIPFKSNSISVNIDKFGHVVGMRKHFPVDSSKLPPASGAIPLDQANKLYADTLHMQKYYQTGQLQKQADGSFAWQVNPKLIYMPSLLTPINAVTGQFLDDYPMNSLKQPPLDLQITGEGDSWNMNHLDALDKKISDLTQTDLSKLTYTDLGDHGSTPNKNNSQANWWDPANTNGVGLTAIYDKASGEVLAFQKMTTDHLVQSSNGSSDPSTAEPAPPITLQQGEATVEKWLPSFLPSGSQEVFLTREMDSRDMNKYPSWFDFTKSGVVRNQKTTYTYLFNLGHQGVPILDQAITLELDPYTGSLLRMDRELLQTVTLPDNTNTVSEDQVKQDYLKSHPLQLVYNWPQYELQFAPSGQMLYEMDSSQGLPYAYDAFTGQAISLNK